MRLEKDGFDQGGSGSGDPSALPIFTPGTGPAPRLPGRARGSFTLAGIAPPEDLAPAGAGAAAAPTPRPDPASDEMDPVAPVGKPGRTGDLDWALVARMRQEVADRLSQESSSTALQDRDRQRGRGREIVEELIERESGERARAGLAAFTPQTAGRLAKAVTDAVFGLGRLQPLVDDDQVENIAIIGCDQVVLELTGGRQVDGDPVAESDEELLEFLSFVATRSEVNARQFSPANPSLHLRLDGGHRLAATAWVSPRPQASIRRHRYVEVSLDDMVGLDALSPLAASFLAAAVRGKRSIVVSGDIGAGKTTLVRALCNEIPPYEVIGTFETEYELHLNEMTERHPVCFAFEERAGSGETGPTGRRPGQYTLSDAFYDGLRMNLTRTIVGEVRGPEALPMLDAMQAGTGSISTTHAKDAVGTVGRLANCVMQAGPHATYDFAVRSIAAGVDVVVHMRKELQPLPDGSRQVHRYVSEIIVIDPGEEQRGYATTHVFRAGPATRVATPFVLPEEYRTLDRFGFDLAGYLEGQDGAR